MEIHELNTFSGTLGSGDYFATDNGTDTSKVSAEAMMAPLNERIDNIIAGPAPSAQEVTDARLGATVLGGTLYDSLGNAIRGQATDIVNDIDYITGTKRINMTTGGYINAKVAVGATVSLTAVSSSSHSYAVVDCSEGDVFVINARGTTPAMAVAFVDSDNKLINRCGEAKRFENAFIAAPANSAKIIINTYSDGVERISYKGSLIDYFEALDSGSAINGYYISYADGTTVSSSSRCVTGYIPVKGNALYSASFIELEGNASIAEYDASRKFIRATVHGITTGGLRFRTTQSTRYVRLSGLANFVPMIGQISSVYNNKVLIDSLEPTHEDVSYTGNPLSIKNTMADGMYVSLAGSSSSTEITACGKNIFNIPTNKTVTKNGVTFTYDSVEKSIRVQSSGATANTVSGSSGTLNGVSAEFDFKFRFKSGRYVTLTSNCSEFIDYSPEVYMQFFSGLSNIEAENGQGFTRYVTAGSEYAVRIVVKSGWSGDLTFYPQVEIGSYPTPFEKYHGVTATVANRGNLKSYEGLTNIFTNDDATITAFCKLMSDEDKIEPSFDVASAAIALNPNVVNPYSKLDEIGGQLCFIDDDTTSLALVQRYHDLFNGLDAVGNYAVMPFRLDADENLKNELLNYEKEGFGMLYHINYQMGDETDYFLPDPDKRDMAQAEDNFVTGLRKMQQYGFSNYRYWVSPYGVNDYDMQRLAKRHGMNCLISTGNNSIINRSNANRWNIPRYGFSPITDNTQFLREALDNCVNNKGMMIVTTHVNTWDSTSIDSRFRTFLEYCIGTGVKIVSFPEAFTTRYSIFLLNELF